MGSSCTNCTKNQEDDGTQMYRRNKKNKIISGPTDSAQTLQDFEIPAMVSKKSKNREISQDRFSTPNKKKEKAKEQPQIDGKLNSWKPSTKNAAIKMETEIFSRSGQSLWITKTGTFANSLVQELLQKFT